MNATDYVAGNPTILCEDKSNTLASPSTTIGTIIYTKKFHSQYPAHIIRNTRRYLRINA